MKNLFRLVRSLLVGASAAFAPLWALSPQRVVADEIDFNRDIRPILSDKCFACHGPDNNRREAELRLDERESAIADRDGPAVIVPGKPAESLLIERILSDDPDLKMPPAESLKELTTDEKERLQAWVAGGAPYAKHWSLTPVQRPAAPQTGAIDHLLGKLWQSRGLQPAAQADPVTLVRRLSFDLRGLPPTAEEVASYSSNPTDESWDQLIETMLDSPHYGERMAVYWLDLVRYADSVGYHGDQEHAITPYRDYVIQSFNDNKPFDQFTLEQLAGDLLPNRTEEQLIGSGYNRVLQTSHEGGVQVQEYLTKYSADRVRNLSAVWLGATLGCAECHDHKYDPYTQRDFYSLAAFFADLDDVSSFKGGNTLPTKREPEIEVLSPIDQRLLAEVEAKLAATKPTSERAQLEARKQELLARKRRTMISKAVEPRVIRILERGDWMDQDGEVVQPATPGSLPELTDVDGRATRIDLARWLTSPDHPQTSRVLANRLWYQMFGAGLTPSLDDMGSQGTPPISAELLDWLASELLESGWDIKHTLKTIARSQAYRMSSIPTPHHLENDPANRCFARQNRYRLPAEFIRDAALQASGLLNTDLGGPSSRPYQPAGYYAHLNFPKRRYTADDSPNQYRRGVYVHWQRQFLHPMLRAFDAPTREECTAKRPRSNTPLAALTLLNDPTFVEAARSLAELAVREAPEDDTSRLRWIWQRVLHRPADDVEQRILLNHLNQSRALAKQSTDQAAEILKVGLKPVGETVASDIAATELAAWTAVCRAVLNLNEAVTRN